MAHGKHSSRGFTLIAALLILVLLSGVAVGLLFMVSNEARMSGNGLENDQAFYAAESGMEKLTADLSSLYTQYMVPTNAQIQAVATNPPSSSMVGTVAYTEAITYATNAQGNPVASWNTISSGSNQGLYAEIVPMTLSVNALRPEGAFVNMTRQVEIALIPVFQFGVFCGFDCSYFAGPNFGFAGRVHTNGNLFLASGADLVFTDKVGAFQQIITDQLENGWTTTNGYGGTIFASKVSNGCVLGFPPTYPPAGANCVALPGAATVPGDASWSGGYPTIAGAANGLFPGISSGTFNGYLANSTTGVTNLQLPFVQNSCTSNPPPCTDPIQIIRKPQPGEIPTSALGSSRMYNKAQIRILLADTQLDLHPERGLIGDGQDVQFTTAAGAATGAPINAGVTLLNTGGGPVAGPMPYAMALVGANNWIAPSGYPGWTSYPLLGELTTAGLPNNGMGAWIRVEYLNNANPPVWIGVTTDWLGYGFSRQYNQAPSGPSGVGPTATKPGADPYDPAAIVILQQMRPGALSPVAVNGAYPINFYDPREGEMRDNANGCAVNGIMNAVELNVGNLGLWLAGKAPYVADANGPAVNYLQDNGYILYYSDHRGMLVDPNPTNGGTIPGGVITGESGLEDSVNSAQILTSTAPDGLLEPKTYYGYSPEDADQNGLLDNWGGKNIGYGFGVNTNTAPPNPYLTIPSCNTTGLTNAVSGARHVLKLVAGGMNAAGTASYLPILPAGAGCAFTATTDCGGFTVASENPVYVQGDYNSGAADPFWGGGTNNTPHSAASIVADSVTLLSNIDVYPNPVNGWTDLNSLTNFNTMTNRNAVTTYYRMAVSGGKNIPFPQPGWAGVSKDFGTDGGLHNFLRLLEDWSGVNLNYNGSLVNMYYSEYNTGTFKCCTMVYNAPVRNFYFDTLFLNPNNLPPGTPMFQDIVNLSYHQNFTPQ
jgi:Tfp pilus assembly protein PilX